MNTLSREISYIKKNYSITMIKMGMACNRTPPPPPAMAPKELQLDHGDEEGGHGKGQRRQREESHLLYLTRSVLTVSVLFPTLSVQNLADQDTT
jgi:hypothetical protein